MDVEEYGRFLFRHSALAEAHIALGQQFNVDERAVPYWVVGATFTLAGFRGSVFVG